MFEAFQRNYSRDTWTGSRSGKTSIDPIGELHELFEVFGGASFRDGLYRVVHPADFVRWQERVLLPFPEFNGRAACFGFDWLGRVFALDSGRLEGGRPAVLMFEPGTGQALEVPANIETFHEHELAEQHDAAVASAFYHLWRASGGAAPGYDECIGYKKPLFLGGVDGVENVELSDLDVYWHLMGQLIAKARNLPLGTRIRIEGQ